MIGRVPRITGQAMVTTKALSRSLARTSWDFAISFICSRSGQISFSTSPLAFLVATHSSRLGEEIFSRIGNEKDPEKRSPGGHLAVCLGFEPSSHQFRLCHIDSYCVHIYICTIDLSVLFERLPAERSNLYIQKNRKTKLYIFFKTKKPKG